MTDVPDLDRFHREAVEEGRQQSELVLPLKPPGAFWLDPAKNITRAGSYPVDPPVTIDHAGWYQVNVVDEKAVISRATPPGGWPNRWAAFTDDELDRIDTAVQHDLARTDATLTQLHHEIWAELERRRS